MQVDPARGQLLINVSEFFPSLIDIINFGDGPPLIKSQIKAKRSTHFSRKCGLYEISFFGGFRWFVEMVKPLIYNLAYIVATGCQHFSFATIVHFN